MSSRWSLTRVAARAFLLLIVTVALAEGVLRLAAVLARDRGDDAPRGDRFRVLALGDSHTFGALVPPEDSYPGQLQRLLDERAPGVYEVINRGVPGFSTAMVRARLASAVARYDPDMVILWVGINDAWNLTDVDASTQGWRTHLDAAAMRLRLYRLLRVWAHDRGLERDVVARVRPAVNVENESAGTVAFGDVVETINITSQSRRVDDDMKARLLDNYAAMVRWLNAADVAVAFITYPIHLYGFALANRSLATVAEREAVPVVQSVASVARLRPEERELLWAAHPNAKMYAEIARDAVDVVIAARAGREVR
jgi:lysophospholipase L1-like esterase